MANQEEITTAIQQGIADVESTFGALSDAQLATTVHSGEGGWTARDILAHLAGRKQVYAMMQQAAAGGENPFAAITSFHDFNRDRVTERDGVSRDDLLTEFRTVHEDLLAQVQAMSADDLAGTVALGPRTATLGDLMYASGGTHSSGHAKEVEQALGLRGTAG
ncbi:MAG TPA: maleylpyruvate isomerase N-terminal domain-containing protein [Thermomicrobiales bacterium]